MYSTETFFNRFFFVIVKHFVFKQRIHASVTKNRKVRMQNINKMFIEYRFSRLLNNRRDYALRTRPQETDIFVLWFRMPINIINFVFFTAFKPFRLSGTVIVSSVCSWPPSALHQHNAISLADLQEHSPALLKRFWVVNKC